MILPDLTPTHTPSGAGLCLEHSKFSISVLANLIDIKLVFSFHSTNSHVCLFWGQCVQTGGRTQGKDIGVLVTGDFPGPITGSP